VLIVSGGILAHCFWSMRRLLHARAIAAQAAHVTMLCLK